MSNDVQPPTHVAVIMDGNGRWAKKRGMARIKGHEEGAQSVRATVRAARDHGVKYLTLYAFSVENWVRPEDEVKGLMTLLPRFLGQHEKDLHENRTRLRATGRIDDLPPKTRAELLRVMDATKEYDDRHLILALSYGGRSEIADACKAIAEKVKAGDMEPDAIDEQTITDHLYLPDVPDPDLMIRTSGEQRTSNFLLWQLSYAEFVFVPEPWPEFREENFARALETYASRHRRFGDVS